MTTRATNDGKKKRYMESLQGEVKISDAVMLFSNICPFELVVVCFGEVELVAKGDGDDDGESNDRWQKENVHKVPPKAEIELQYCENAVRRLRRKPFLRRRPEGKGVATFKSSCCCTLPYCKCAAILKTLENSCKNSQKRHFRQAKKGCMALWEN